MGTGFDSISSERASSRREIYRRVVCTAFPFPSCSLVHDREMWYGWQVCAEYALARTSEMTIKGRNIHILEQEVNTVHETSEKAPEV